MNAEDIFGPNVGSLMGKTVERQGEPVVVSMIPVPSKILLKYGTITLCIDVIKVNTIPFLITIARFIKYCTSQLLLSMEDKALFECIRKVKARYSARGFTVKHILADGQFKSLQDRPLTIGIHINCVAENFEDCSFIWEKDVRQTFL